MAVTTLTLSDIRRLVAASPSTGALDVAAILAAAPAAVAAASPSQLAALVTYRVPRASPDGTCSRPDDLDPAPFDLLAAVHGTTLAALTGGGAAASAAVAAAAAPAAASPPPLLVRLWALREVMRALAGATGADWCGVYRAVPYHPPSPPPPTPGGADDNGAAAEPHASALVKEAYVGAPSRAYFPLTPAFAAHSNNSTVGLTGAAILLGDTRSLADDTPYYVCDGRVRAELCAPIFAPGAMAGALGGDPGEGGGAGGDVAPPRVIGIVDVEAFAAGHFTPGRVAAVLRVCAELGEAGMWEGMLL